MKHFVVLIGKRMFLKSTGNLKNLSRQPTYSRDIICKVKANPKDVTSNVHSQDILNNLCQSSVVSAFHKEKSFCISRGIYPTLM